MGWGWDLKGLKNEASGLEMMDWLGWWPWNSAWLINAMWLCSHHLPIFLTPDLDGLYNPKVNKRCQRVGMGRWKINIFVDIYGFWSQKLGQFDQEIWVKQVGIFSLKEQSGKKGAIGRWFTHELEMVKPPKGKEPTQASFSASVSSMFAIQSGCSP